MNITIVGAGYVGLVSGACFAEMGNHVHCIDVDEHKISRLSRGEMTIYEPDLESIVRRNLESGRLSFSTDLASSLPDTEILFIAVGTPPQPSGAVDMSYVHAVARTIGQHLEGYTLVVTKSTVPVGTSAELRSIIRSELESRGRGEIDFDVASNPEFLKEGDAVNDFMKPDRVVVGVDSERAKELMTALYKPMMLSNFRVLFMDIASAEMTKYAANAMLATRISFMNDIANLCELVGADVSMVRRGIGSDSRIGTKFLYPGCGYGGSCFPKDVRALIDMGAKHGYPMKVLQAVDDVNNRQKELLFDKLSTYFDGDLQGRKIALWGLAFKPGTDDMREAPSLILIDRLLAAGCSIVAYDPVAMHRTRQIVGEKISYADNIYDTVIDADAIVHVTEWKEFRMPNWNAIAKLMKHRVIVDGRNVFDEQSLGQFDYLSIGQSGSKKASL